MYREDRNGQARKKTVSEGSIPEVEFNGDCTDVNCGHIQGKSGAASVNGVASRRKTSRTVSMCEQRQPCKFGFHLAVPMGKRSSQVHIFTHRLLMLLALPSGSPNIPTRSCTYLLQALHTGTSALPHVIYVAREM